MARVCERLGMSRQNYYVRRRQRQRRVHEEALVEQLVKQERRRQGRLGGRKLRHMLAPPMAEAGVRMGRDRFFELLRDKGLLVERKRGHVRTTNSRHSLPVFHNKLKDMKLTGPGQAWVSDLTYIRTEEGFMFAALITDAWSRKIVGSHISDSLEADGCLEALEQAIAQLSAGHFPTHHSDRGCQYCCHRYVERLQARQLGISMTEQSHCYENAMAERVNGILKQEYELDHCFRTKAQAREAFEQAVTLYNHYRPHTSLHYACPAQVHEQAA